jgi:hypothetical protein
MTREEKAEKEQKERRAIARASTVMFFGGCAVFGLSVWRHDWLAFALGCLCWLMAIVLVVLYGVAVALGNTQSASSVANESLKEAIRNATRKAGEK